MQFKFKIQDYQSEAARAVTDVFGEQLKSDSLCYQRDLGSKVNRYGQGGTRGPDTIRGVV